MFGLEIPVTINAKGFRGPDVPFAREEGRPRILFLGDSLTWGFGVKYEDIFVTRLEAKLPGIETVNLAVSGYSTDQELLLYRDEGRKYQADIVVAVVAYNDNDGNQKTVEYLIYGKPAFVLRGGKLELVNQPVARTSWLKRAVVQTAWHSYLLSGLQRFYYESGIGETQAARRARHDAVLRRGIEESAALELPEKAARWALTVRLLFELAAQTRRDGADLVVVLANGIPAPADIARSLATQNVDTVILDDAFGGRRQGLFLPDDTHWNAPGHEVVARTLATRLAERLKRAHRS
jgi:lysophospholipase L1-like esterase